MKIVDEKNISPEVLKRIEEIAALPRVREVVVFPDVHLKEKYTNLGYRVDVPSSIAILTENCLYPQFRPGINCGMSLVKTDLFYENSLLPRLEKVLLNLNKGLVRNFFNLFRFPLKDKYSLADEQFQKICQEEMADFDYSGIRPEWRSGTLRLKRKMGKHFGGNHFLEFQTVEQVFDQETAEKWGIKKGQIMILYHTAGDPLDDILEKEILRKAIYQPHFVRLEASSREAKIILKAIKILTNYGFAYRQTTYSILKDLFAKVFGSQANLQLFSDHSHNSVEEIKKDSNNPFFLYRHNVNKVEEGLPVTLSGSFNLRSYVNKGSRGAEEFLYSCDHGYGDLLKKFTQEKDGDSQVRRILFKNGINLPFFVKKEKVPLERSPAADHLLSLFKEKDISSQVFSLKPIVNFKFV